MRLAALSVSLLSLLAGGPAPAQAEAPAVERPAQAESLSIERLFADAGAREVVEPTGAEIRTRLVAIDADALQALLTHPAARSADVRLNLFEDASFTARTDRLEPGAEGDVLWRGRIGTHGYATLVRRGGETAGIVRTETGVFEIVPAGDGRSRLAEIHLPALAPCGVAGHLDEIGLPRLDPDRAAGLVERLEADQPAEVTAGVRGADLPTLDQLVAYTPAAMQSVGGTVSGMSAFIDNAILDFNTVLENNSIPMRTRVVFKLQLDSDEVGSGSADLSDFRFVDGKWDEVFELRDDFGADVCHLLVRDSNVCGIASMIYRGFSNADELAFCLTDTSCVAGLTFVHEVGHLIGCAHDTANTSSPGTFPYSLGWFDPDPAPTWHTVMSYRPAGSSSRIPYFSTPNVSWSDGNPLGSATFADNARTIAQNVSAITAWRPMIGLAPTGLEAQATPVVVLLDWPPAPQAVGYEIWRSTTPNPLQSSRIATVAAPQSHHVDMPSQRGRTYYYFLKSLFADGGVSGFSESASAGLPAGVPADLNGDGVISSADLSILLAGWGTPTADLSGDLTTNTADLAVMLAAWSD